MPAPSDRQFCPRPHRGPLLVFLGAGLSLFFWPIRFDGEAEFQERLLDAAHLPLFAVLAGVVFALLPRDRSMKTRMALTALVSAALAALIEIAQPALGRTESFEDFRNGIFGAGIALLALAARRFPGKRWLWPSWALMSAALVGLAAQPAWQEWRGLVWRADHFPLLGDFESEAELRLWHPQGGAEKSPSKAAQSSAFAARGQQSLRVQTGAGSWAGVNYSAGNRDWSRHRTLAWSVFNPREAFALSLRIDDDGDCSRFGERFDRGFTVRPGWNHFQVPLSEVERGPRSRKLNLKSIRRAAFFTGAGEPAREFFLDHVRLE